MSETLMAIQLTDAQIIGLLSGPKLLPSDYQSRLAPIIFPMSIGAAAMTPGGPWPMKPGNVGGSPSRPVREGDPLTACASSWRGPALRLAPRAAGTARWTNYT